MNGFVRELGLVGAALLAVGPLVAASLIIGLLVA